MAKCDKFKLEHKRAFWKCIVELFESDKCSLLNEFCLNFNQVLTFYFSQILDLFHLHFVHIYFPAEIFTNFILKPMNESSFCWDLWKLCKTFFQLLFQMLQTCFFSSQIRVNLSTYYRQWFYYLIANHFQLQPQLYNFVLDQCAL